MKNPHLLRSYGVIEQGDLLHIIFPWAECNLRDYWKSHSGPLSSLKHSDNENRTSNIFAAWDEIVWLSDQIRSIFKGLAAIHHQSFYRHGALKPENILLLRLSAKLRGKLFVTDFGATVFRTGQSIGDAGISNLMSLAYRSPESDLEGGVLSKCSDMWSLGCLILDFMSWTLEGRNTDNNNTSSIESPDESDSNISTSLTLFTLETKGTEVVARIKPAVTEVRNPKYACWP
jgi:serine/threonine protein kinase